MPGSVYTHARRQAGLWRAYTPHFGKLDIATLWGRRKPWGKKKTLQKEREKFALCPEIATCDNALRFDLAPLIRA